MSEKEFVNGLGITKKTFNNGGSIIKVGVKVEEFKQWLDENQVGEWLNFDIKESRTGKMYAEPNFYRKESKDPAEPLTQEQQHEQAKFDGLNDEDVLF